jgi:hypothetical protein
VKKSIVATTSPSTVIWRLTPERTPGATETEMFAKAAAWFSRNDGAVELVDLALHCIEAVEDPSPGISRSTSAKPKSDARPAPSAWAPRVSRARTHLCARTRPRRSPNRDVPANVVGAVRRAADLRRDSRAPAH